MPLLADHLYTSKIPTVVGGGLLTTVDNLPAILKRQYPTSYKPKSVAIKRSALLVESPLDLTVKTNSQLGYSSITPPSTPSPPPKKRYKFDAALHGEFGDYHKSKPVEAPQQKDENSERASVELVKQKITAKQNSTGNVQQINKNSKAEQKQQVTPQKPIQHQESSDLKMGKSMRNVPGKKQKRNKATRKLKFDEETSSPVSGTIIRRLEEIEDEDQIGDIDPEYNIVEVTEEAKAEIAAIANVIGDYVCKLCRKTFEDAFELARHRCSCIVLLEYRCPECGKRFNCPANLASHRRWHKPRPHGKGAAGASSKNSSKVLSADKYSCQDCKRSFKRLAYLKKHQLTHKTNNQVVAPAQDLEDSHNSHSNASFYSHDEGLMKVDEEEDEAESVAVETYHPNKLQTFTQIVFRYASSMNSGHSVHGDDEDDHIVYSPMSRGSTPISMCSRDSPPPPPRTEDENLAAAALAALARNGSSVIRHTTLSV